MCNELGLEAVTLRIRRARDRRGGLKAGSFPVADPFLPMRPPVSIASMKHPADTKCQHCHEGFLADCRNLARQCFCQKPDCRRASKANSQRQWRSRPENQDYFRGSYHCERVRRWRNANPDYCRRKSAPESAPESATESAPENAPENAPERVLQDSIGALQDSSVALQDACLQQSALIVGLIALVTGHALQDDIAASVRTLLNRGRQILRMAHGSPSFQNLENPPHSEPRTVAERASPA